MTAYFDGKGQAVGEISRNHRTSENWSVAEFDALRKIDETVVFDVTICVEWPGFPEDLRKKVHEVVLHYSVECQPVGSKYANDYEDFEDLLRGIGNMIGDLHTIFHEVAQRNLSGFSDNPLLPLRCRYARGEEQREEMAKAAGMLTPQKSFEGV